MNYVLKITGNYGGWTYKGEKAECEGNSKFFQLTSFIFAFKFSLDKSSSANPFSVTAAIISGGAKDVATAVILSATALIVGLAAGPFLGLS